MTQEESPNAPDLRAARSPVVRPCRLRILIIDDDPPFLRTMKRRLQPHEVTLAVGAVEAFAILDDLAPDVIFCDLHMPCVRGVGVYEYLRRVYPGEEERIVFMTGSSCGPQTRAYLASVPNPVLQKPISEEELEAALVRASLAPRFDISRASSQPRLRTGG